MAARIPPKSWEEDWRVMNLRRLSCASAPPSLLLWGRHDPFFELAEVLSWMQTPPRMEARVFDAGHKLLETHAAPAVSLMLDFIRRTQNAKEPKKRG